MIVLKNVSKAYGRHSEKALKDVSLSIPRGEIIGIFGENGAGKTTLMKSILGLQTYEGEITLDGASINRGNIMKCSFATCEHSFFSEISAQTHRDFYESHFPMFRGKRFDGLMEFFDLPMNKKVKIFSTGQKNQFEVILALSQGADYILMDEPFAGNDVFNREDFYKVLLGILEENETVILSTHLIEEVEKFIGRAIFLSKGSVVADCQMEEIEESGNSLLNYVKKVYEYENNRVTRALGQLTEEEM